MPLVYPPTGAGEWRAQQVARVLARLTSASPHEAEGGRRGCLSMAQPLLDLEAAAVLTAIAVMVRK